MGPQITVPLSRAAQPKTNSELSWKDSNLLSDASQNPMQPCQTRMGEAIVPILTCLQDGTNMLDVLASLLNAFPVVNEHDGCNPWCLHVHYAAQRLCALLPDFNPLVRRLFVEYLLGGLGDNFFDRFGVL